MMAQYCSVVVVIFIVETSIFMITAEGIKCPGYCTKDLSRCRGKGGKIIGYCTNSLACCDPIVAATGNCGDTKFGQKIVFFKSPNYPEFAHGDSNCEFKVKLLGDTVAIRVEFLEIVMDGKSFLASEVEDGECESDMIFLRGFSSWAPPPRCGNLTSYSVLIDRTSVIELKELQTLTILALMSSLSYRWHIKITQILSNEVPHLGLRKPDQKATNPSGDYDDSAFEHDKTIRILRRSVTNDIISDEPSDLETSTVIPIAMPTFTAPTTTTVDATSSNSISTTTMEMASWRSEDEDLDNTVESDANFVNSTENQISTTTLNVNSITHTPITRSTTILIPTWKTEDNTLEETTKRENIIQIDDRLQNTTQTWKTVDNNLEETTKENIIQIDEGLQNTTQTWKTEDNNFEETTKENIIQIDDRLQNTTQTWKTEDNNLEETTKENIIHIDDGLQNTTQRPISSPPESTLTTTTTVQTTWRTQDNNNEVEENFDKSTQEWEIPLIINGEDAEVKRIPWQASLRLKPEIPTESTSEAESFKTTTESSSNSSLAEELENDVDKINCSESEGFHFCGGVLISDRFILTAAHCFFGSSKTDGMVNVSSIQVILGDTNLCTIETNKDILLPSYSYDVENIIFHYGYDEHLLINDIAVLKLKSNVKTFDHVKPIRLAKEGDDFTGREALVSGWGDINETTEESPIILQSSNKFVIQNRTFCNEREVAQYSASKQIVSSHPKYRRIFDSTLCSVSRRDGQNDTYEVNAGKGDSGGPAAVFDEATGESVLVGVVSYGVAAQNDDFNRPVDFFTSVSFYRKWIELAMLS